ncbi:Uncharacterised protein [Neisseria meningitidis]|nr:Uncharacterised protein [Neisseria meningitidis]
MPSEAHCPSFPHRQLLRLLKPLSRRAGGCYGYKNPSDNTVILKTVIPAQAGIQSVRFQLFLINLAALGF